MARILLGVTGRDLPPTRPWSSSRSPRARATRCAWSRRPPASSSWAAPPSRASPARPCSSDEFERDPARGAFPGDPAPDHDPISHLELVRRCDVLCVAPASANTLAKLAARAGRQPAHERRARLHRAARARAGDEQPHVRAPGHAGEPGDAAPARRARSWSPGTGGWPRRGEWGVGRLAEPAEILAAIEAALGGGEFAPRSLDGLRVLVTAGGTREPIDSVRYVGNRSSGRMGLALAEEAARRGAEVTVVAANVSLPRAGGRRASTWRPPPSSSERRASAFADADVLLMAAAVRRLPPGDAGDDKITKAGRDGLTLELEPTADVLAASPARRRRPGQTLVGFAAEHGEGARRARPREARAQGPRRRGGQRHLARRHRLRQPPTTRSRSSPRTSERRGAARRRRPRWPRRSSTRSSARGGAPGAEYLWRGMNEHERERIRPVQEGQRAARGRRLHGRRGPARACARRSSRTRPRSARPSAAPTSAPRASSRRPRSSPPSWSAHP